MAMENVLQKYFEERFRKEEHNSGAAIRPRPVITISREYGCPARDVCSLLMEALNAGQKRKEQSWRLISKEILQEAATELHVHPSKIEAVLDARDRTMFDEMVDALGTRQYKSDRTIRSAVSEVVRTMARNGHLVILGMGAASILHGYPNVLNIKLVGPEDWRVANIARWKGINRDKALNELRDMDDAREKILQSFLPAKAGSPRFDLIIDCMSIGSDEIVEILVGILAMRP
jgi:cytidylate kinase